MVTVPGDDRACPHARGDGADRLAEELRALVLLALDRLDPVLVRLREVATADRADAGATCPLCTVLAAVGGERPEPAARFAEHAAAAAAALRAALDGDAAGTASAERPDRQVPTDPERPRPAGRPVERIAVDREQPRRTAHPVRPVPVDRRPASGGPAPC